MTAIAPSFSPIPAQASADELREQAVHFIQLHDRFETINESIALYALNRATELHRMAELQEKHERPTNT